jgi:hypothetical protein
VKRKLSKVFLIVLVLEHSSWWCYLFSLCTLERRLGGPGMPCHANGGHILDYRVNVSVGPQEDRMMTTGRHTVADIFCNCCQQLVGWKYVCTLTLLFAPSFERQYHVRGHFLRKDDNPIDWIYAGIGLRKEREIQGREIHSWAVSFSQSFELLKLRTCNAWNQIDYFMKEVE